MVSSSNSISRIRGTCLELEMIFCLINHLHISATFLKEVIMLCKLEIKGGRIGPV